MVFENVGIDIIEIERVAKLKDNRRFLERVFTKRELDYCFSKQFPERSLATRFAAKEAAGKALNSGIGIGKLKWTDVEVKIIDGNPKIFFHGIAQKRFTNPQIFLSLSHTKFNAVATVFLRIEYSQFERFQKL